jgi:DNA-binding CsgD family transcriptional regulator
LPNSVTFGGGAAVAMKAPRALRTAARPVILGASAPEVAMSGVPRRGQRPDARAAGDLPEVSAWPQPPRDLELSFVWIDGEELAVLSHPLDEPAALAGLTEAERRVAADVVDGLSNERIAHRRGTAASTVAKQIGSVFRKLGVGSRRELVAMMKGSARSGHAAQH